MKSFLCIMVVAVTTAVITARPKSQADIEEEHWHVTTKDVHRSTLSRSASMVTPIERTTSYWNENAQSALKKKTKQRENTNKAKNVILFIGDGMSIPTLTAVRTYLGQLQGKAGEEEKLHWESFPYTGLSKTYCVNSQVADSACSATTYLCGVKTNDETIGVNAQVPYGDCQAMTNTSNHLSSIAEWALDSGKSAGVVTTTRVTHASPSGTYARTAHRDWENDAAVNDAGFDAKVCKDIATQLVTTHPGKNFQIIDNPNDVDYVFGLFETSHCQYNKEAVAETEPTLAEMTEAAIKIFRKNSNGYFLFVEGGRIDHAHHDSYANLALDETVAMAAAVRTADELTDESDTLIVVTSDHAHVMTISGYPERGNDILGIAAISEEDKLPYTTLSYANGPGYKTQTNNIRYDITNDDFTDPWYRYPTMVPRDTETHGGDDVTIFARGPWSHLFTGTMEQNNIPHFMAYASCIGKGLTSCT